MSKMFCFYLQLVCIDLDGGKAVRLILYLSQKYSIMLDKTLNSLRSF